ncbi:alpha/beta fold hydrolase [Embleya sp. NPDC050493]|uniref:alpha/beta fold hydrolase n=1 Tax=Embleya sp. NPDC050493 TaxID=3363989 RepID=UPI0037BDED35
MDGRKLFRQAYDEALSTWPAATEHLTVPTPQGPTRVYALGPRDAPPLLLLPGGGATSLVWRDRATEWAREHRVYAVDLLGQPGRSRVTGRPPRTTQDLCRWLDAVLDGLGVARSALGGHSYGGWIALHYALWAPERVERLVLVDPTLCFARFRLGYLLRALPGLVRPTPARRRAFTEWETRRAGAENVWRTLDALAAAVPTERPVIGPRPAAKALRSLRVPVLVLLAEAGRAQAADEALRNVRLLIPHARASLLPGTTHHGLPQDVPQGTDQLVREFLAGDPTVDA